MINTTTCQ